VRQVRRREFIATVGAAALWPIAARAQQSDRPLIALINPGSSEIAALRVAAFRKGLNATGYIEGQNVTIEYHWLEGNYDRLPALMADLVRKPVAIIATPGFQSAALAAKAATSSIPIVFGVGDDPVKLGLVSSLARPGGNATGTNSFVQEVLTKRLRLLHELLPRAVRVAVIVNPSNAASSETTIQTLKESAPALGMQIEIFKATTIAEIDAAFAAFSRDRPDALFVAPDGFLTSRGVQFATLAARHAIPTCYTSREIVSVGGLMSYGTDLTDMFRQVGVYAGSILKGAKPGDLAVLQPTKFDFAINIQTARALGIEIPPGLLAIADEVIE